MCNHTSFEATGLALWRVTELIKDNLPIIPEPNEFHSYKYFIKLKEINNNLNPFKINITVNDKDDNQLEFKVSRKDIINGEIEVIPIEFHDDYVEVYILEEKVNVSHWDIRWKEIKSD